MKLLLNIWRFFFKWKGNLFFSCLHYDYIITFYNHCRKWLKRQEMNKNCPQRELNHCTEFSTRLPFPAQRDYIYLRRSLQKYLSNPDVNMEKWTNFFFLKKIIVSLKMYLIFILSPIFEQADGFVWAIHAFYVALLFEFKVKKKGGRERKKITLPCNEIC